MQVSCSFCNELLEVPAADLGQQISCPHCMLDFELTAASLMDEEDGGSVSTGSWLSSSLSMIVSTGVHTALLVCCALVTCNREVLLPVGDEVTLGELPVQQTLTSTPEENLEVDAAEVESADDNVTEIELEAVPVPGSGGGSVDLGEAIEALATSGTSMSANTSLEGLGGKGSGASGVAGTGAGNWGGMLRKLQRDGLEVVFLFDSTGSMGGEIEQVKLQITRIGSVLQKLVPKTRFSIVSYRDRGDAYEVKGIPLSRELSVVRNYLSMVTAGGGGDFPEAVHKGLEWSISKNEFRSRARKVILLFGDAPPHPEFVPVCISMAREFRQRHKGVVSTVTCRSSTKMSSFVEIAEAGGGEAFLTANERELVTQLMVLVFGSRYRNKVLEAFRILGP